MLSKTAQYALRALSELAAHPRDEAVVGRELSKSSSVPASYLSRILLTLNRAGLVEGTRGTGGGYRLTRSPREIPLIEIIEPIDNVSRLNECLMGMSECSEENPCAMHDWWRQVRDDYLTMLRQTTLAEVSHCTCTRDQGGD